MTGRELLTKLSLLSEEELNAPVHDSDGAGLLTEIISDSGCGSDLWTVLTFELPEEED